MAGSFLDRAMAVGDGAAPSTANAVIFEYSAAANPLANGATSPIPTARFGAELYESGPSRIVPLDLSSALGVPGPATSPALCANFVRLGAGDALETAVNASSEMFYVIRGRGQSCVGEDTISWSAGDFLTLPAGPAATHTATEDAALYWVHDAPLLAYLGAHASEPRFSATRFSHEEVERCLAAVAADPEAQNRSRISVLLANRVFDQTLTLTHVQWAMYGILPAGGMQPSHRHQSVALDFVVSCAPGCYTLLGDLDERTDRLVNVQRVDWEPGAAFVTPPGRWHSHHNESGEDALILPVQDAGLQTYLRSLDIRFMDRARAERALAGQGVAAIEALAQP